MKKTIYLLLLTPIFSLSQKHHCHHEKQDLAKMPINNIAKECTKIGDNQTWYFNQVNFIRNNYNQISLNATPNFSSEFKSVKHLDFIPYHHFSYFKSHNIKQLTGNGILVLNNDSIFNCTYNTYIDIDQQEDSKTQHSIWYIWKSENQIILAIHEKVNEIAFSGLESYSFYSPLLETKKTVKAYPTPTKNFINFDTKHTISQVTIMNNEGRTVLNTFENVRRVKINLTNFTPGIYYATIKLQNGSQEVVPFQKM